ncbi:MAG: hypothetical protein ACR2QH_01620 [Geminicoccaceae bacterium]
MVACPKPPKPEPEPEHVRRVAQLPCCCTLHRFNVDPHHLIRDPDGGHCAGRRSGGKWTVPLRADLHRGGNKSLHFGPLDEPEFFAQYGVDQIAVARKLWALTEAGLRREAWLEAGRKVIEG